MGIFRHFPYTNFHDLNLDWILAKIKELWEGVFEINKKVDDFIYNTEPLIRDEVDNWLDSHPEATTTVLGDHSEFICFNDSNEAPQEQSIKKIIFTPFIRNAFKFIYG